MGPRRLIQPALRKRELPRLDAVLLSHAHMDHTDLGTLRAIPPETRVVVQSGNRDLVRRFHDVDELAWGQTTLVAGLEVESVQTRHWGARMVTDRHRGWGGYLLRKQGRTVLFGGDTAYTDLFTPLRERGPGSGHPSDRRLRPLGDEPRVAGGSVAHVPGARGHLSVPIHHSTFRLSREPMDEPMRRLLTAAGSERWRIVITEVGQTWSQPEDRSSAVA